MTTVCGIRTHHWTEEEERALAALEPVFGDDLYAVIDTRRGVPKTPVATVTLDNDWLKERGLATLPDWGWRCGDYALYALYEANPDADFFWLIEPDVYFSGGPARAFEVFAQADHDVLAVHYGKPMRPGRFSRGLPEGMAPIEGQFGLVRFSNAAVKYLFEARKEYCKIRNSGRFFTNDECFCFSYLSAQTDFTGADLKDVYPDGFERSNFTRDPDIFFDALEGTAPVGSVWHPVRSKEAFIKGLAKRIAGASGFIRRMGPSLSHLSTEDHIAIADAAKAQLLDAMSASAASAKGEKNA
ncbi:MAG: component of SufBCD complex [Pseudomonadota bacterium]